MLTGVLARVRILSGEPQSAGCPLDSKGCCIEFFTGGMPFLTQSIAASH